MKLVTFSKLVGMFLMNARVYMYHVEVEVGTFLMNARVYMYHVEVEVETFVLGDVVSYSGQQDEVKKSEI